MIGNSFLKKDNLAFFFLRVAMCPDRKPHFPTSFAFRLAMNMVLTNKIKKKLLKGYSWKTL